MASAAQPAIKARPPTGVTGPILRYFCGSRVSRYRLPLNRVMPPTKRAPAPRPLRRPRVATRVATEWMSWYFWERVSSGLDVYGEG